MEAEDVQCRLLYRNERVTIARECGGMLMEERAVSRRWFVSRVGSTETKWCRIFAAPTSCEFYCARM